MTTSRFKYIHRDEGVNARVDPGAVVGGARESTAADKPEVVLDDVLAVSGVGTEPGSVSGGAVRDAPNVRVRFVSVGLGVSSGGVKLGLLGRRAAGEGCAIVIDAGDSEVARRFGLSNILNSHVNVLGGAVNIDTGEEVRWLDGVDPGTGSGEVVRSGN